ncbi:hypothetical protein FB567DRAFT_511262 [Paraphoma chrysanthemicola]|uniref:Ankyrin n=1 Tax=Paraphoma chrysanthemicola TaxID=798071 RepID=A0A8K0RF24_9PLEO|nr:hypothetical protein FB567DRAFT_511262 [Paraphoma chrysanthemicola]
MLDFAQIYKQDYLKNTAFYDIISTKAVGPKAPDHPVLRFITSAVDTVLKQKVQVKDIRKLRLQYISDVCGLLPALDKHKLWNYMLETAEGKKACRIWTATDIIPAAAAMIGHTELLFKHVHIPRDILEPPCAILPSAITAAVVSGECNILSDILKYLKRNLRGFQMTGSWDEMRVAAHRIGEALRCSVRLHKNAAAIAIFEFIAHYDAIANSMPAKLGEQLINDCFEHGNGDMAYACIVFDRNGIYCQDLHELQNSKAYRLKPYEERLLLRHGHKNVLQALIKRGQFDPNACQSSTSPLKFTLQKRRQDLALVLLQNGVDIDAVPEGGDGKTVLWHAANEGWARDVKFLLEHGADPRIPGKPHKSVADAAFHSAACRYMIGRVLKEGNSNIDWKMIWEDYEQTRGWC